jgi:high-affinity iron transporter
MFETAVIVFREVLEAALIVGVVAAATRGVVERGKWLAYGMAAGIAGSALVALGTERLAALAEGVGQEIFNASILGVAVLMLAWHNIWMASHGRALAAQARVIGGEIRNGHRTLSVLMIVVAIAVLREGSETVLFLYGIAVSGTSSLSAMAAGGALGIAGGVAVGTALYRGLLRIPVRWFFGATSLIVLLLTAGLAAQAARFLVQADLLPSLASPLWDTSRVISNESMFGALLRGLIGYDAHPSGIQVVFYATVAVAIAIGMQWIKHVHHSPKTSQTIPT